MKTKETAGGFSMPALGMGTWQFGGRSTRDPMNDDEGQIRALHRGLEMGYGLIDTAEMYADGYAETLTGRAIAGIPRDTFFLTSKIWKTHLHADDVILAVQGSLRRLNTDHLDLCLYHQVSEEVPLEETIGAMDTLVDRGVVRYIGVSNFAVPRLAKAMKIARHSIVVNQVHYSLTVREAEPELLAFCQKNDVILQAWRPLRGIAPCPVTDELCRKYQVSLQVLALAWLLNQKNVTAITAMKNPDHLGENLSAENLILAPEDVERLRNEMENITKHGTVPLS